MTDYLQARPMFVDENRVFIDQNAHLFIVLHKTASPGMTTAAAIARYFATNAEQKSSHYVVDSQEIIQCVAEKDGAAANCCPDDSHAAFWNAIIPHYANLNWCTISIESVDADPNNATPMPQAQKDLLFPLVKYLMVKYHIPISRVVGHDSICRTTCPGNFPWSDLRKFLAPEPPKPIHLLPTADDHQLWNLYHNGIALNPDSAIGQGWLQGRWLQGRNYGPPMEAEHEVTRGGVTFVEQQFTSARASWNKSNGHLAWYGAQGEIK